MATTAAAAVVNIRDQKKRYETEESVAPLIANFKQGVTSLDLGGNSFGRAACTGIAKALIPVNTLRELRMDDMFTTRKEDEIHPSLKLFAQYIPVQHLVYMDFSDNALNHVGAQEIQPIIARALSLETLKLNNTGISHMGGQFVATGLLEAYTNSRNAGRKYALKTFILGRSRLHNEGITPLARAFKKIGTLEEIRVFNNGITPAGFVSLVRAAGNNPNLRILEASDNVGKKQGALELAAALRNCPNIETLLMEDAFFHDEGMQALLPALASLKHLKAVNFAHNGLSGAIAQQLNQVLSAIPTLTTINLNGNGFGSKLPVFKALQHAGKLETLSEDEGSEEESEEESDEEEVVHDDLSDGEDGTAPKEVSFRDKQKRVDTVTDAAEFLDELGANLDSTIVDLGGNTFSLPACEALSGVLAKMTSLRILRFDDMFTMRKVESIHPSLRAMSQSLLMHSLVYLDLSDNALNPSGAEAIAPLISNCLTIKTLRLNNTGVGPTGGVSIGKALAAAHAKGVATGRPYTLHHFVLGRSRMENPGMTEVAAALQSIGTLVEIRVNNNGVFPEGMAALGRAIGANPNLEVLDVSDNVVKAAGAAAFGKSLPKCHRLRLLVMQDTRLRDVGGAHIVSSIKGLSQLGELDLSYDELTATTARRIAAILPAMPALTEVRVNGNEFGETAISELRLIASNLGSFSDDEGSGEEQSDAADEDEDGEGSAGAGDADDSVADLTEAFERFPLCDRIDVALKITEADDKEMAVRGYVVEIQDGSLWADILFEIVQSNGASVVAPHIRESAIAVLVTVLSTAMMGAFVNRTLSRLHLINSDGVAPLPFPHLLRAWRLLRAASTDVRGTALWKSLCTLASDSSLDRRKAAAPLALYLDPKNTELTRLRHESLAQMEKLLL